jgi:predicted O-methyltransferase YrrM
MNISQTVLFSIATVLLLLLIGVAVTFRKVRRVHLMMFDTELKAKEKIDNLYTQLECLLALQRDLNLPASMPLTRGWAGSPDFLRHVMRTATTLKPDVVVECSSGTSTVVLARTVQLNGRGHVFSLEHEPIYAQRTRDELKRQGLDSYATVIDAPLQPQQFDGQQHLWYKTDSLPQQIDLLVIDGPPMTTQVQARYPAVPAMINSFSPNIRVLLDDASRPDETEAVRRWKNDFGLIVDQELVAEKGIAVLALARK